MEDDIKKMKKMEEDLKQIKMEDDHNFVVVDPTRKTT